MEVIKTVYRHKPISVNNLNKDGIRSSLFTVELRDASKFDEDFLYTIAIEYYSHLIELGVKKQLPTREQHHNFFQNHLNRITEKNYKKWYIAEIDGKPVGAFELKHSGEFGYSILKEYQGRGYSSLAFEVFFELHPAQRHVLLHPHWLSLFTGIRELGGAVVIFSANLDHVVHAVLDGWRLDAGTRLLDSDLIDGVLTNSHLVRLPAAKSRSAVVKLSKDLRIFDEQLERVIG